MNWEKKGYQRLDISDPETNSKTNAEAAEDTEFAEKRNPRAQTLRGSGQAGVSVPQSLKGRGSQEEASPCPTKPVQAPTAGAPAVTVSFSLM